jgi:hypothetical protein
VTIFEGSISNAIISLRSALNVSNPALHSTH